jgi:hypothetical protein
MRQNEDYHDLLPEYVDCLGFSV